jgi:hypothetical protein
MYLVIDETSFAGRAQQTTFEAETADLNLQMVLSGRCWSGRVLCGAVRGNGRGGLFLDTATLFMATTQNNRTHKNPVSMQIEQISAAHGYTDTRQRGEECVSKASP